MIAGLLRQLDEMRYEADCLRRGRYPAFVAARKPDVDPEDVPVFVFHTIEPDEFEAQLRHLVANDYRTLDCAAFHALLTGTGKVPPRSVLLTIDDGRASVWTYAVPLLKKYGLKAVVFLIPGYIRESTSLAPTLEEVWAGKLRRDGLPGRDPELMNWAEVEAAAASGLIDFQSHTLYHHRVPVSRKIVDYINPQMSHALFDVPVALGQEGQLRAEGIDGLLGAPVYESDSLMAGRSIYRPDPRLAQACIDYVRRMGEHTFFRSPGWRKDLARLIADWREHHDDQGSFDDASAVARELATDLRRSRVLIEQRLPGTEVRHLCYPYTVGSAAAVRASRDAGYLTNFWGVLPDRRTNRAGNDPYHCPRLKGDYLQRLPGRGRNTLTGILARKINRRVRSKPVY
jgi:peptidoglycan/xylan/chitin deacetylase (PgdA/CDA1 family)